MFRGALVAVLPFALLAQIPRDLRIESDAISPALPSRGARWALVIGISSYRYAPPAAQLQFAHRDAEEFAAFLRGFEGGSVPADHIRLLTNSQATLAQIRAALHTWLVDSARPDDIVYFFFAGHGVLDAQNEGYLVAHDSDPQNLHATGVSFAELDATLSRRLRASLVVMVTDACHAGRLGWTSYSPDLPSQVNEPLARIGADRAFLKLLATRPSERSFESDQWDGGHGAFTYSLLQGLRGAADLDGDHVIRASEAIDYVSRRVPELTGALQHPRVAGTFDARAPIALAPQSAPASAHGVPVDVSGPPGSSIYLDSIFRGRIRPAGTLRIDAISPGLHAFSADFPDGATLDGRITLGTAPARVIIAPPTAGALAQMRRLIDAGRILQPDGAWPFYRSLNLPESARGSAGAMIGAALEEIGQACVSDYVQSTAIGPKNIMLRTAVEAYSSLRSLRPNDSSLEARRLFCAGRLEIAEGRFSEAVTTLRNSLQLDPQFACAYNALGVALGRLNRAREARKAFDTAASLTPEWALPPYQIASQLIATNDLEKALPYLKQAVSFNPRSVENRWTLLHLDRLLRHTADAERDAAALIELAPDYAPTYTELGLAYEADRNISKALEAYDTYVLLAPHSVDANGVRARAARLRSAR